MKFNIIETYELIDGLFPGLVELDLTSITLVDERLGDYALEIYVRPDKNKNIYITMYGNKMWMKLEVRGQHCCGALYMEYDFNLSPESCMGLYKHNILIFYMMEDKITNKMYDRVGIERAYTIRNIIKDEA